MIVIDLFESEIDEIYDFLHDLKNTEFQNKELSLDLVKERLHTILYNIKKCKIYLENDN